jgi:hypothetical protein
VVVAAVLQQDAHPLHWDTLLLQNTTASSTSSSVDDGGRSYHGFSAPTTPQPLRDAISVINT